MYFRLSLTKKSARFREHTHTHTHPSPLSRSEASRDVGGNPVFVRLWGMERNRGHRLSSFPSQGCLSFFAIISLRRVNPYCLWPFAVPFAVWEQSLQLSTQPSSQRNIYVLLCWLGEKRASCRGLSSCSSKHSNSVDLGTGDTQRGPRFWPGAFVGE